MLFRGAELSELPPVDAQQRVGELRAAVARRLRLSADRVALRLGAARLEDDARSLASYGAGDAAAVEAKDLGPQFSYRGVFIIEYAGPIVIVLAAALRLLPPPLADLLLPAPEFAPLDLAGALRGGLAAPDGSREWSRGVQALGVLLWVLHFAKRELETLFVHKFSRKTMPLANLWRNCAYYWLFAAFVALPLCSSRYTAPPRAVVLPALLAWCLAQAANLAVHLQFAFARGAEGDRSRAPPGGPLFALVTSPNYSAEVAGWAAWTALTHVAAGGLFTLVGLAQMTQWALQKHAGYAKGDPAYARARKAIVPFII